MKNKYQLIKEENTGFNSFRRESLGFQDSLCGIAPLR